MKAIPLSLSPADLSIIRLALKYDIPIALDDNSLRIYAEKLGISLTGSLGLLKSLYQKKIIETREEYMAILNSLQEYVYITDELIKWALDEYSL